RSSSSVARFTQCAHPFLSFLPVAARPARSTLSPYTTLFRSGLSTMPTEPTSPAASSNAPKMVWAGWSASRSRTTSGFEPWSCSRSEEHTSELQSRENLVCRLLLEKKNNKEKDRWQQSCLDSF